MCSLIYNNINCKQSLLTPHSKGLSINPCRKVRISSDGNIFRRYERVFKISMCHLPRVCLIQGALGLLLFPYMANRPQTSYPIQFTGVGKIVKYLVVNLELPLIMLPICIIGSLVKPNLTLHIKDYVSWLLCRIFLLSI